MAPTPPRVLLVGAYERDNFGDLLFLLVTEHYLAGAEVVAAAPFAADMRALLDRDIAAYGQRLQDESFDAIWTVGGQVGRIDLARAYRLSSSRREFRRFARASATGQQTLLRQATGGAPIVSPYIPLPYAFPRNAGALTVINSVGIAGARGIEGPRRDALVSALRGANAVTVRDHSSSRLLEDLGIEHRCLPDAVHALGRMLAGARDPRADTAIVQISRSRLRMLGHAHVGEALAASPQLAGRPVRLLLAGTATGHDTEADYELVMRAARGLDIAILEERRPLAIAERIRDARVVIGTSLHVRVVAAAYGVARVSLPKPKPTRYAKNWDPDMPYDVGLDDLDAAVEAACARAGTAEAAAHAESLAQQAHENLEALAALVMRESRHGAEQRRREREQPQGEALAALLRAEEAVPTRRYKARFRLFR